MSDAKLDLASPRWCELSQAFGSAEDIPRLLEALASVEDERERAELWFGISATLCPDGRTFTASYAAVPHLLSITRTMDIAERVAALHVAAEVETLRHTAGAPAIPDDIVPGYALAIESLPSIVAELVGIPWHPAMAQVIAAALLAGKRQPAMARALLSLGEAE